MQINKGHVYHFYNSGNNTMPIFYCRDNYLTFLEKLHAYILPYADVLSWCLLPDYFHLMLYVREAEIEIDEVARCNFTKRRTLNRSVSIMLCSYTRTIMKKVTGSVFQHSTEAVCLTDPSAIIPVWYLKEYGATSSVLNPSKDYPQLCFNYIHNAPVKEGLVKSPEDWEFSSFPDVAGLRNGKIINRERIGEMELFQSAGDYSYL